MPVSLYPGAIDFHRKHARAGHEVFYDAPTLGLKPASCKRALVCAELVDDLAHLAL